MSTQGDTLPQGPLHKRQALQVFHSFITEKGTSPETLQLIEWAFKGNEIISNAKSVGRRIA